MATQMAPRPAPSTTLVESLVAAEGSGSHRYLTSHDLLAGKHSARNLADAVHHLCLLHGRHPGVADHASIHTAVDSARQWLFGTADAFVRERNYMTKLVVAVGPLPSTPGQAQSESAVNAQRHAIDMLAQSDRNGCALGATIALSLDWPAIRDVLNAAARRFSVDAPECRVPDHQDSVAIARQAAESASVDRAMIFGAQQVLAQHRGLWDLLEARQLARGEY
jgi:hypothetical protein